MKFAPSLTFGQVNDILGNFGGGDLKWEDDHPQLKGTLQYQRVANGYDNINAIINCMQLMKLPDNISAGKECLKAHGWHYQPFIDMYDQKRIATATLI